MMAYLRNLLTLIFAISLMHMLLDCEIKNKSRLYWLGAYAVAVVLCNLLVLLNFGYATFMRLYPLLIQTTVLLGFMSVSRFSAIKVLFVHLTAVAVTSGFVLIGLILAYLLGSPAVTVNVVCYILYLPTWFIFRRFLRPSFLYMLRNTDKGWLGFCVIPLLFSAFAYANGNYNLDWITFQRVSVNSVFFLALTLAAYSLLLRSFRQTREQLALQSERHLLETQITAARLRLEALKESHEKTIIYRHDMRHHLNLINAYLEDNNEAAARAYITEVGNAILGTAIEEYCGNYAVNLILSSYISKARDAQIATKTLINLPESNAISDMDLCVILANAIENAVNACSRVANVEDRFLTVSCTTKNGKLLLQIINSYPGEVQLNNNRAITVDQDHGVGIKSITAVAQKYGGFCSFTADKGVFRARIIL